MSRPIIKGKNDLLTLYPDVAKEWHPTKNQGIDINNIAYGSNQKVWWLKPYDTDDGRHFDFEWQATVYNRTIGGVGCPYLCGKKVYPGFNDFKSNFEELANQWHPTKNGDLTPDKVPAHSNKCVWWFFPYDDPKTGKHFDFEWEAKVCNRVKDKECPFLSNKRVWIGYNDLKTTHPKVAACLLDKTIGTKTTYGTKNKYKFVCPTCGNIVEKLPSIVFNENDAFVCPTCSDGFSYPEKFLLNMFQQLGVEFIYQLTKSHFKWCGDYRYDFYIPQYKMIVEINGEQHYRDCSWTKCVDVQQNDYNKKTLALNNGINVYIQIDARSSTFEYVKHNIENALSPYFDLSDIKWDECELKAVSSILVQICSDWEEIEDKNISLTQFAKMHNMDRTVVRRYLTTGNRIGICNYELRTNEQKKVVCLDDKLIFDSLGLAGKYYGVAGATIGAVADNNKDIYKDHYHQSLGKHFVLYNDVVNDIDLSKYIRLGREDVNGRKI